MQFKYVLNAPPRSTNPLRKLFALVVTVAVFALLLMFSAVLFVLIVVVGSIALAYLWWKTREVRKAMREFRAQTKHQEVPASNDEVFEGEVIRVVDPKEVK